MSAVRDDDAFSCAAVIIAASRFAALADGVYRRILVSAAGSRALAIARRAVRAFREMPAGQRYGCAAVAIVTAVAGHAAFAALEPPRTRPATALTVMALLAIALAAIAALDQTSEP